MEQSEKNKRVADALAKISKQFGNTAVMKLSDKPEINVEAISTGSLGLDIALGIGGLPKGRVVEIYGPESSGKAQPLSSHILTPAGWIEMRDVEEGMVICTPDGGTSTIVGIYPQGEQDVYRITLDDKSTVECTSDHLWSVQSRDSKLWNVMSTQQIIESGLGTYYRKFKLPNSQPCHFATEKEITIDPYLLGLLLGDGCLQNSVTLSSQDAEILQSVSDILQRDYDMKLSEKRNNCDYGFSNRLRTGEKNGIVQALIELGLYQKTSEVKFIPDNYLFADVETRIALFQGLIDSDGYIHPNQHSVQYVTVGEQLAKDFVFLARSLGMRCVISDRINSYTAESGNKISGKRAYYINCLHGDFFFQPARLTRKQLKTERRSSHRNRFIESIELVRREECQCIMIGHPDSLYITDNFTVTHNTTLTIHIMAEAQKLGGNVGFVDAEMAFDPTYATNLGVDLEKLYFAQPSCGEEALEIAAGLIESGGFDVIVIDSVAALVPKAELDGEMGDAKMGLQARMMSQAMRKITASVSKSNTLVIFINQLREKIGVMFGSPEVTTGGNALKFYASVRLDVRRSSQVKDGDEITGNLTKVKVVKNKVAPPFKVAEFDIMYGQGISKAGEIVDLGVQFGVIKKSGSWYSYGDTKLGQGRDGVKQIIEDNPDLMNELEIKIKAQIV